MRTRTRTREGDAWAQFVDGTDAADAAADAAGGGGFGGFGGGGVPQWAWDRAVARAGRRAHAARAASALFDVLRRPAAAAGGSDGGGSDGARLPLAPLSSQPVVVRLH